MCVCMFVWHRRILGRAFDAQLSPSCMIGSDRVVTLLELMRDWLAHAISPNNSKASNTSGGNPAHPRDDPISRLPIGIYSSFLDTHQLLSILTNFHLAAHKDNRANTSERERERVGDEKIRRGWKKIQYAS